MLPSSQNNIEVAEDEVKEVWNDDRTRCWHLNQRLQALHYFALPHLHCFRLRIDQMTAINEDED